MRSAVYRIQYAGPIGQHSTRLLSRPKVNAHTGYKSTVFCEHQLLNSSSFWFHISRDRRQFLSQIQLHSFQSAQRHDKCLDRVTTHLSQNCYN